MTLYSNIKDPKPAMEDRHSKCSHYNGKDINIVVLGVKGVGKSALTVRFLTKRFIGDYDSEMEAVYSHSFPLDGKTVTVHILDTAWQTVGMYGKNIIIPSIEGMTEDSQSWGENGTVIKEEQIMWADAILLVYSITDRTSFEKLKEITDFVISKRPDEKIIMALVGNKCDLIHMKSVTDVEATQFAAEYNSMFFEISASDNFASVFNMFIALCRQIKLTHKKREKLSKFMQNPAVAAKLQIRNSLRSLAEMKWRTRTPTM